MSEKIKKASHNCKRKVKMKKYEILKSVYGYDTFREGQEELIDAAINYRDALGIMPTGAGKSLCFQIPALMFEGITIVVSPLISLMKDQVAALNQAGVHAAYINSSLTQRQVYMAMENARMGRYKIIYVAPERLMTAYFQSLIGEVDISMIVVDEAHCISQWGQDFRPSYLKINEFIDLLPYRPVITAYTATATAAVRDDILKILKLENPKVVVTGYDRKNLYFAVKRTSDKYGELMKIMNKEYGPVSSASPVNEDWRLEDFMLDDENTREYYGKSGIIYCNTRNNVDEVYEKMKASGYPVAKYHAGLTDEERRQSQEDFIFDRKPIMIATNAFGMGIDKSNVRFVVHYNMPKDLESYYQEAGRAGRDGDESKCILLYSPKDVKVNEFLISKQHENEELDEYQKAELEKRDLDRLAKMTFYCTTNECLRDYILKYFGEKGHGYCGKCENCLTEYEEENLTKAARNLIGIISNSGERFGMTLMISALHGSANEKIYTTGLNENDYFATSKDVSMYKLRQLASYMLEKGYLYQMEGRYPIVKISDLGYDWFLNKDEIRNKKPAILKFPKEKKVESRSGSVKGGISGSGFSKNSRGNKTDKASDYDEAINSELFEALRKLRLEISREEHMPPYIIFTDVALKEMSKHMPVTKEQMLDMKGVGEYKYNKYGKRFLDLIRQYK